jgi:hypothetical protein
LTNSILFQLETNIAFSTYAIRTVEGLALVGDGLADTIFKIGSISTFDANIFCPNFAEIQNTVIVGVDSGNSVDCDKALIHLNAFCLTFSLSDGVSSIASEAGSVSSVPSITLIVYLFTNLFVVKKCSISTFNAIDSVPNSTKLIDLGQFQNLAVGS